MNANTRKTACIRKNNSRVNQEGKQCDARSAGASDVTHIVLVPLTGGGSGRKTAWGKERRTKTGKTGKKLAAALLQSRRRSTAFRVRFFGEAERLKEREEEKTKG